MINRIEKLLYRNEKEININEFKKIADLDESNFIEKKSLTDFINFENNKGKILEMLSKQISAFANYNGGLLLLGVNDKNNIEKGVENIYKNTTIKEWMEDVIWTSVSPQFNKFSVKAIKNENDKYLFLIVIGKNSNMAHQANYGKNKYRYFSRISGKSQPIDGILVHDVFKRDEYAVLEPTINVEKNNDSTPTKSFLELELINKSLISAEKAFVLLHFMNTKINGSMLSNKIRASKNSAQYMTDIVYPKVPHSWGQKLSLCRYENLEIEIIVAAKNMLKQSFKYKNNKILHEVQSNVKNKKL